MKDAIDGRAALGALSLAFRRGDSRCRSGDARRSDLYRDRARSHRVCRPRMSPSPPRSTGPTSSDDGHLTGVKLWLGIESVAGPNICCNFDDFGRIFAAELLGRLIGEFL